MNGPEATDSSIGNAKETRHVMRTEIANLVDELKRSIGLLRRHL